MIILIIYMIGVLVFQCVGALMDNIYGFEEIKTIALVSIFWPFFVTTVVLIFIVQLIRYIFRYDKERLA